ncbi:MAG TPA: branched-chain alpha-keto acid dehydrogenase subunit E2 [Candidatus Marinimicrobia bacterium]|nr:branched-chain alpha-keto acid dehydrogenase subunit E2 [Candidatus Neomarinimicrobiota bacterium]
MADILLPELGEGITSVEISEVLVKKGDTVKVDDPIIVVETEKASMEIPTTESGTVENVQVEKGSTISPGDVIISITGYEDQAEAVDETSPHIAESAEPRDIVKTEPTTPYITAATPDVKPPLPATSEIGKPVLASPSVRRFARELGCDLKLVTGSGPKGRITQEDVQEYIKGRLAGGAPGGSALPIIAPGQDLDFSKWGEVDIQPLNKIKKITGKRLQQAWQAIPHVTQFDKADITKLDKLRLHLKKVNKDESVKVSFLPFFIKAVSILLKEMPQFNSSLDGSNENIVLKKYINIGVAVDTPNGLVVPVIKDANEKSIKELARELTTLSSKARDKKLLPADMEGGCFTISSLGGIGGTYFTPIVNPPEVAILGISRSTSEPVFMEGKLRKRLILPFALSYDHRLIDGAAAARFTSNFGQLLSNFEEIT